MTSVGHIQRVFAFCAMTVKYKKALGIVHNHENLYFQNT